MCPPSQVAIPADLAPMLERVEPEVGQARDIASGCEQAEDPAFIARAFAIGKVEPRSVKE